MKLSEIKGDAALDVLAELIDPIAEIFGDKSIRDKLRGNKFALIKALLKEHKKSIIAIMAALDRVPVEEYDVNLLTLPVKLLEMLNDPEIASLFTFAEPRTGANVSGSASATDAAPIA